MQTRAARTIGAKHDAAVFINQRLPLVLFDLSVGKQSQTHLW
jgi:hypothetical protein